jgi:hypothetical protein
VPNLPEMPLHFLADCSEKSLRDFALSALSHVANLRKAKREIDEELLGWEGRAQLAEWLIAHRGELAQELLRIDALQKSFDFRGDALGQLRSPARAHDGVVRNAA